MQWSGMSKTLASWENVQDLRRRFLGAPTWGQAGFQGEENVTHPNTRAAKKKRKQAEDEYLKFCPVDEAQSIRRSRRERQQTARFYGPDWTE